MSGGRSPKSLGIWLAAALLAVLHQDLWQWDDRTLVMGFMPIGLFYHALFSLAATALWLVAVRVAWPSHLEEWADDVQAPPTQERHS